MTNFARRELLRTGFSLALPGAIVHLVAGCNHSDDGGKPQTGSDVDRPSNDAQETNQAASGNPMKIHYLEIVTSEADALCAQYATLHKVKFSEPVANLGGARTAEMSDGSLLGIRGPMHDQENDVVRPYVLVEDIKAAVDAAAEAGALVAVPPMEIPGYGTCAIFIQGGIESGLWQI